MTKIRIACIFQDGTFTGIASHMSHIQLALMRGDTVELVPYVDSGELRGKEYTQMIIDEAYIPNPQ